MQDKQAAAPDSTSVRVALWRAMHVQIDPPRTCLKTRLACGWSPRKMIGAAVQTWIRSSPAAFASIVARARFIDA